MSSKIESESSFPYPTIPVDIYSQSRYETAYLSSIARTALHLKASNLLAHQWEFSCGCIDSVAASINLLFESIMCPLHDTYRIGLHFTRNFEPIGLMINLKLPKYTLVGQLQLTEATSEIMDDYNRRQTIEYFASYSIKGREKEEREKEEREGREETEGKSSMTEFHEDHHDESACAGKFTPLFKLVSAYITYFSEYIHINKLN